MIPWLIAAIAAGLGVLVLQPKRGPMGLTQDDLLWLGRALVGETGASSERAMAAVSWAMYQRWQQLGRNRGRSFTWMLQAYCQPINPKWASLAAEGCRAHPEMCTVAHLSRRARITGLPWNNLPLAVRSFVERFGRGVVANPVPGMIDFAAFNFQGEQTVIDGNHFGTRRV